MIASLNDVSGALTRELVSPGRTGVKAEERVVPCIRVSNFGGPRRIMSFPRSVSAPRVPGSEKSLSASAASISNR